MSRIELFWTAKNWDCMIERTPHQLYVYWRVMYLRVIYLKCSKIWPNLFTHQGPIKSYNNMQEWESEFYFIHNFGEYFSGRKFKKKKINNSFPTTKDVWNILVLTLNLSWDVKLLAYKILATGFHLSCIRHLER